MTGSEKKESSRKPLVKKWWFWVIIAVVALGVFSCGGSSSGDKADDGERKEAQAETETEDIEPAAAGITDGGGGEEDPARELSSNPLMNCKLQEAEIRNESGNGTGRRGYIDIPASEVAKLTNEQIAEFSQKVVKGKDYSYFTIDFGTGKGIVFPECTIERASIGEIGENGEIKNTEEYLYVSGDGTVKIENAAKEEIPEKTDTQQDMETAQVQKAEEAEDNVSTEYKNALRKAGRYAEFMHMSKQGIYDQLTSEYGEGFPADAAQYAIDHVTADWNANALAKAKNYSDTMHMSRLGIYDQLTSEYGEKFLPEEAQYAVDNVEADWNANALAKARNYRDSMGMSTDKLYEQLISEYGEKFTADEAQYAIDHLDQ